MLGEINTISPPTWTHIVVFVVLQNKLNRRRCCCYRCLHLYNRSGLCSGVASSIRRHRPPTVPTNGAHARKVRGEYHRVEVMEKGTTYHRKLLTKKSASTPAGGATHYTCRTALPLIPEHPADSVTANKLKAQPHMTRNWRHQRTWQQTWHRLLKLDTDGRRCTTPFSSLSTCSQCPLLPRPTWRKQHSYTTQRNNH